MTALKWPAKIAGEVLDYAVDWSARLGTDTIDECDFASDDDDLEIGQTAIDGKKTSVWLSAGTRGAIATVTATILTANGRAMIERVSLPII